MVFLFANWKIEIGSTAGAPEADVRAFERLRRNRHG